MISILIALAALSSILSVYAAKHSSNTRKLFTVAITDVRSVTDRVEAGEKAAKVLAEAEAKKLSDAVAAEAKKATAEAEDAYEKTVAAAKKALEEARVAATAAAASKLSTEIKNVGTEVVHGVEDLLKKL